MFQIVTKFGGTSVSSRETWEHIFTITSHHLQQNKRPIIVCSALTQASNQLEELIEAAKINQHEPLLNTLTTRYSKLANELEVGFDLIQEELDLLNQWLTGIALLREAPAKTHAQVLSVGELMLTRLGHAFLNKKGIRCHWLDAREALVSLPGKGTNNHADYCAARCESKYNPILVNKWSMLEADAILTQGFIAANPDGETVLLGRGGSDTSAALFAALLKAEICEIWTDVPGVYTANPHQLPHARLLKQLNYDEAQEIASMGAKVLHPLCIPPVRQANIPLVVKYTCMPDHSGTRICTETDETAPPIKSIQVKHSITLISIDTVSMWQQVGFLSDVFNAFKQHNFSVDLLSSSEANITLSLDPHQQHNRFALEALLQQLNSFCRAQIIEPCSAVSLVGHHIRRVLPHLGSALEVFDEQQVYLMSLASNDLNLTFVVDESKADKLCQKLHHMLIESNPQSFYYSKSWHEEFGQPELRLPPWWELKRDELLSLAETHSPCYIYNCTEIIAKACDLKRLQSIDNLFYAVKANPNKEILQALEKQDINFECVSIEELQHIIALFPQIDSKRILFTPNFASKIEYEQAIALGVYVTIDSLYPLTHWSELFVNHEIFLRIDPGCGAGHHKFVCTGGNESKFGIPLNDLSEAFDLIQTHKIQVIGLHAHSGSGILSIDLWQETALMLAAKTHLFQDVKFINLGGGLGIAEKPGQMPLDLLALDHALLAVKSRYPQLSFWLEPGRYFVAESGVLLAKVTQCKEKGKVNFVGIETGMNSLLRPALYGAYHQIINLTRINEEPAGFAHIVGPICESGDTLGYDRVLPITTENDILLIANTGAYGHCMSSFYNLRAPAKEFIID